jgi:hypothetical protein
MSFNDHDVAKLFYIKYFTDSKGVVGGGAESIVQF